MKVVYAPLLGLLTELMAEAEAAGDLRPGTRPRRAAVLIMQTAMFIAQSSEIPEGENGHPFSADAVWDFCTKGFARG